MTELLRKVIGIPLSKEITTHSDGTILVRGYFTTDEPDEVGDVVTKEATLRAIPKYRQWGNVRYMHQPKPVGKVVRIGEDDGLAWNEVEIHVIDPQAVFEVRNGLLQALSIGALIKPEDVEVTQDGGWIIHDYTLAEISLVDHPANYGARLEITDDLRARARSVGIIPALKDLASANNTLDLTLKSVVPYRDEGQASEDTAWERPNLEDFLDEPSRFEDLPRDERIRIMRHFTWTANVPPETYEDLKLPHHRPSKSGVGEAVWNGVRSAMAALFGARGGVDIPASDMRGVYEHLAKHYKEFGKEPPDFERFMSMAYEVAKDVFEFPEEEAVMDGILEEALTEELDLEEQIAQDEVAPVDAEEVEETASTEDVVEEPSVVVEEQKDLAQEIEEEEKEMPAEDHELHKLLAELAEELKALRQEITALKQSLTEEPTPTPANRVSQIRVETPPETQEEPQQPVVKDLREALRLYFMNKA